MPELDSLRGIACLLVLLFHGFGNHYSGAGLPFLVRSFVRATSWGWTGVNLFFVLSGFLITGILFDSKNSSRYYARFYYRRALRILPAYYAILLLLIVVWRAGVIDRPMSWSFLGLSAIYLANSTTLFGVLPQYGVLWSLAVEEHFYILWPLCVRKLRLGGVAILAGLICILSLACRAVAFKLGFDAFGRYTWLVADGLAMGALLAITARVVKGDRRKLSLVALGWFAVAFACYLIDRVIGHTLAGGSAHITSINAIYAGVLTTTLLVGSRFSIRQPLLEFFGEISYGLYLIHLLCFDVVDHLAGKLWPALRSAEGHPFLMVCRFFIAASLAVTIAVLSRHFFEEPFLRLKDRLPFQSHPQERVKVELTESATSA